MIGTRLSLNPRSALAVTASPRSLLSHLTHRFVFALVFSPYPPLHPHSLLEMFLHGNGSINSPIVISDEEDAAYVERELGGFGAWLTDPEPPFQPQTSDIPMYDWGKPPVPLLSNMQMFGNNGGGSSDFFQTS